MRVGGGRKGIRFEGLLSSYNDDFEMALDGTAAITVGGTLQSQLTLYAPYMEMHKGTCDTLVAIEILNSSRLAMWGGQAYGDSTAGSVFFKSTTAYGVSVQGVTINRWESAFAGMVANDAAVVIGGNQLLNIVTPNAMTNLNNAKVGMLSL